MPTNFWTWFWPSFWFSGWNNQPWNNQQLTKPTKQQKFPWLSDEQIKRLESISSDPQRQQELYKQAIQQLNSQNVKDNRIATENEMAYRNLNQKDVRQKNYTDSQIRLEQLADLTKDKFWLRQDAPTQEVVNWVIAMAQDKWVSLDEMNAYLDSWDQNFLYNLGLKENPKEKLRENAWDNIWDNIRTKANVPIDNIKKRWKRTFNEASEKIYKGILKNFVWDSIIWEMGIDLDDYVDTITDKTVTPALQQDTLNYQNEINERYRALEQKNLDQDIKNYYDNKGYTKLLKEWDFKGFLYKSMWDAAQNWEMPVVIAASVFQPEIWMALMTTDAYARENQEAFENMMNNWATYEQAEQWAVAVWLVNAAVEVTLEKLLWWVETSASSAIRKTLMKNVQEEAAKKWLGRILLEWAWTQLRSSTEEWLEEIVQQIVQNAAVKTVNENQKLFEWVGSAFEWWFYNPMNLLAWGGNINQNIQANKSEIRQSIMDTATTATTQSRDLLDAISDKAQDMWDTAKNKVSWLVDQTYGIDETLRKDIQDNPYSAQVWARTKNYIEENGRPEKSNDVAKALITDVADRVQESLMDKMEEWSEAWRLYKPLLDAGYSVDLSELKDWIDEMLEKYWIKVEDWKLNFDKTAIDGSEANNIRKIYNWIKDTNKPMSLDEYKNRFRKTMSDMVDFNQVGRDQAGRKKADTQWDIVLKWIRSFANDLAHNQIPELAAVDKKFNEWVQIMDEVSDGLVYKDKAKRWVIRDNISQIIKNLDTPNRRELANRLEKIMPWITEEVRAINKMPQLIDHYYKPSGLQQTLTSSAWAAVWGAIGGIPWWILWAWAWYLASKWIDKFKSAKWDKIISETSEDGKAKLNDIQARIENNEKISQEQKAFLEEMSNKLKEWKSDKEAEVAKIIAEVSSAEWDVESALNNAIDRLETLWAKQEVKEMREALQLVQNQKTENMDDTLKNQVEEWATPVKEMTPDEEYQEKVNRIMTPEEAMQIVQLAWNANNLKEFYDWEYNNAEERLKWAWPDQVEMYAENTFTTQRMIESHPELLDGDIMFSEVLEAYLNWTLKGSEQVEWWNIDLTEPIEYTPTKFYEPQQKKDAKKIWETANQRVTKSNSNEVYQARWDFVIQAHDPNFAKELGISDAEVNKKLRDWAVYPVKAKELSNRINKDVNPEYRWGWLENSSIVKSISTTDADLEKMVKKVEWDSQEWERKYISNTMLALDTHIDWGYLTFQFNWWKWIDYTDRNGHSMKIAWDYNPHNDTIRVFNAWQNTVAHEMWHYLDHLWGRQLYGYNVTLSEWGARDTAKANLTEDQKNFVAHFDNFMRNLRKNSDISNEYMMTPTEMLARFVARFTEWTRKTATSDRYSYETKYNNDKFLEKDYIEFAKLLQEKSKLDLANEYTNYEEYKNRFNKKQWDEE